MRSLTFLLLAGALTFLGPAFVQAAETSDPLATTMKLIEKWITVGHYDNALQVDADLTSNVPDHLQHRPMYQLFARIDLPNIGGITYFQQAYLDGDEEAIVRVGLTQYFPDPDAGSVRMRELHFNDEQSFYHAHKDPSKLKTLTLDDLWWDDFYLLANDQGTEIRGPMQEGTCILQSDVLGIELAAEDEVVIRSGEFWFLGRYVDAEGNVMWGNESDELNKLVFTGKRP